MASRKILVRKSRKRLRQRFYFVVVAVTGEPVATSEMYRHHVDAVDEANRLAKATFIVRDEAGAL